MDRPVGGQDYIKSCSNLPHWALLLGPFGRLSSWSRLDATAALCAPGPLAGRTVSELGGGLFPNDEVGPGARLFLVSYTYIYKKFAQNPEIIQLLQIPFRDGFRETFRDLPGLSVLIVSILCTTFQSKNHGKLKAY
jgi:hypothetical protein